MATSPVSNIPNEIFAGVLPPFLWQAESLPKPVEPPAISTEPLPTVSTPADVAAARDRVLLENLPLVRFVARRIHERLPQHVEMEDLVSAGILGLIDAFNKFNASKNVQFHSYAQFRIRGAILDSLRGLDWGSRELRRKGRSIENATQNLTRQLNRRPSESEIAAALEMPLDRYQELRRELRGLEIGSLQELCAEDSVEEELAFLPTAPEEDPLHRCIKSEATAQLCATIAELPEREARVLALYYVEEMTLKEIGLVVGLVESRVSQIRTSALANLRAQLAWKRNRREIQPGAGSKQAQPIVAAAVMQKNLAVGRPSARAR